jgi:major membrane immunogen (membrane-anchored lipoprotein)
MKKAIYGMLVIAVLGAAAGCGKRVYRDGVYDGRSGADDTGAWGAVNIIIEEGSVTGCNFVVFQEDGVAKGEDYGKINGEISNQDYYNKAQLAVRAIAEYARQYSEVGDLGKVDAISGATIAFNQFTEAVEAALEKAR